MSGDGDTPDDLVEPEGVDAGGPVTDVRRHPSAPEQGGRAAQPPGEESGEPSRQDNGELLSGAEGDPTRRPPQPGQELAAGEG